MQREDAAIDPLIAGEAIEHRPYIVGEARTVGWFAKAGGVERLACNVIHGKNAEQARSEIGECHHDIAGLAHLKGPRGLEDLAIEMLARGLSVRDIEDAFKDEGGRLLFTAVSQGAQLWEDYQTFAKRELSEYEIIYLFVDGNAERLRAGAKREPVLAAWGYTVEGRGVQLHLMARKMPRQ
jgi:hypothetical protein